MSGTLTPIPLLTLWGAKATGAKIGYFFNSLLAVIAFGFVVEKFNVMVEAVANTASPAAAQKLLIQRLAGPLGRYDGIALILVGIGLIVIAGIRYARTAQLIDKQDYLRGTVRTAPRPRGYACASE
jgi:hypothetical protein